jgi:hypothetical protein
MATFLGQTVEKLAGPIISDRTRLHKYESDFPLRGPEPRDEAEIGPLAFRQPSLVLCSLIPKGGEPSNGRPVIFIYESLTDL